MSTERHAVRTGAWVLALLAGVAGGYAYAAGTFINYKYDRIGNIEEVTGLASDPSNCGAVGTVCPGIANGYGTCADSKCGTACNTGYSKCVNQCIALATSVTNCGACGNICPGTANGYPTCSNSQCGIGCNSGYTSCGGQCVVLASNVSNCGACGVACPVPTNGSATCSSSQCGIACNAGYTSCGGKCVVLSNDVSSCGGCGIACPVPANGYATCSSSQCGIACYPGFTNCGGRCVPLSSDVNNCGNCGTVCSLASAGASCVNGQCSYTCNAGTVWGVCTATSSRYAWCSGTTRLTTASGPCIDLQWDVNNCGSCGRVCPAVANGSVACVHGQCSYTCAPGLKFTP